MSSVACRPARPWRMVVVLGLLALAALVGAQDLPELRQRGELRHLGVPYANFVTGSGDGLDVELIKRFAAHLGLAYRYVATNWADAIGDLTGTRVERTDGVTREVADVPVRGDVIANGMTVLDWREALVRFGAPTFATQVWLVARAGSVIDPIAPGASETADIAATLALIDRRSVLGKSDTCLDPALYDLDRHGARDILFHGPLNELVPALIAGEADLTLLDVPDALVSLEKWAGQIKVIGPVSTVQRMAPAFRKGSPALRAAFDAFFAELVETGEWQRLVRRYYPYIEEKFPAIRERGGP